MPSIPKDLPYHGLVDEQMGSTGDGIALATTHDISLVSGLTVFLKKITIHTTVAGEDYTVKYSIDGGSDIVISSVTTDSNGDGTIVISEDYSPSSSFIVKVYGDGTVTATVTSKLYYNLEDALYCSTDDVAQILQYNRPNGFTTSTTPSSVDVREYIYNAMEEIDQTTGHAWRERKLTDYEYHNIDNYHLRATGIPIHLNHRNIKQFDSSKGDVIEIWNGAEWEDFLSTGEEGRNKDYWVDYELGTLYLRTWLWLERPVGIRVKYRYGETYVPSDIKKACAELTAVQILYGEDRSVLLPEGSSNIDYDSKVKYLKADAEQIINRHKEWRIVDTRG